MENFTGVQETEQFYNETARESLYIASDSSGYDYNLEIWPKGRFSFSPEKGYEGEAEKVKLSKTGVAETSLQKEISEVQSAALLKDSELQKNNLQESRVEEEQQTSRLSFIGIAGLLLFFLALGIGWYLRRGN